MNSISYIARNLQKAFLFLLLILLIIVQVPLGAYATAYQATAYYGDGTSENVLSSYQDLGDITLLDASSEPGGNLTYRPNAAVFGVTKTGGVYTNTPLQAPNLSNVRKVYAYYQDGVGGVAFAIKTDGTIWSWGNGMLIGRSTTINDEGKNTDDPVPGQVVGLSGISDIRISINHVVAVDTSGKVWAWGLPYAFIGIGDQCTLDGSIIGGSCDTAIPHQVPTLSDVKQISVSPSASFAILSDNTLRMWGTTCNVEAYYPTYKTPTNPFPDEIDDGGQIVPNYRLKQIEGGYCTAAFVTTDGQLGKWGFPGISNAGDWAGTYPLCDNGNCVDGITDSIRSDGNWNFIIKDTEGNAYAVKWLYGDISMEKIPNVKLDSEYYAWPGIVGYTSAVVKLSQLSVDSTPPILLNFSWNNNPKSTTQSTDLTVHAADNGSGIAKAEYFIGDTDPGQGNGATMTLANQVTDADGAVTSANLTTTFGTNFTPGVYKVSVRAQDVADNWSAPVSDYLVVYDPSGPNATGNKEVQPSLSNGDILPGLTSATQTDKASFGFTVKYGTAGVNTAKSDLQFSYDIGKCSANGKKPAGCTSSIAINATNIAWLVADGQNLSHAVFQGTATVVINGITTTNPFRVEAIDGSKTTPTSADHFTLRVYAPGANPSTDTPIYQVNDILSKGRVAIK